MKYLGIDLGGTNVAADVVDSEGTILGKVSLPTPRGAEAVADQMAAAARGAAEAAGTALDEVVSVGIGAPGAIEPDTGVIKYWSNLDFTNVPITALMKARLDKEILLENDANAAALGEYAAGAGKGSQSMVAVTLGTGVGGGAILNGKLYTGFNYAGMEIGHFVIGARAGGCAPADAGAASRPTAPPQPSSSAPARRWRRTAPPGCGSWRGVWRGQRPHSF